MRVFTPLSRGEDRSRRNVATDGGESQGHWACVVARGIAQTLMLPAYIRTCAHISTFRPLTIGNY